MASPRACVRCLAGDVDTAFAIRANLQDAIVILHGAVELSTARASETLTAALRQAGLDPDDLPEGELTYVVRLCDGCSGATGTPVDDRTANVLPGFIGTDDGGSR
jgi:hypothetical protein